MAIVGYARVSTDSGDQTTAPQIDALKAAGCDMIHEEFASGADRTRPQLARCLASLRKGDVLVVARLDRLARSLVHLMQVVDGLQRRGVGFRSLGDPIDTTSPQGRFTLQILGAVGELERALIRERTIAGLRGKNSGNPGLKRRDPTALHNLRKAQEAHHDKEAIAKTAVILPMVERMRPGLPWSRVVRALNADERTRQPDGAPWTDGVLRRAIKRLVAAGLASEDLLARTRRGPDDQRLVRIVAGIAAADAGLTLQEIGRRLQTMGESTPRGGLRWSPSSVKNMLDRGKAMRLCPGS